MNYIQSVIDEMAQMKRDGLPFDQAWAVANSRHRYRPVELGIRGSMVEAANLFEQPEYEALEWWRGVCERAYNDAPAPDGSPSKLRGLRAALENGFSFDEGRAARKVPGRRAAA